MAEAASKIAKSIENITPHNKDLRPQFQNVSIFNVKKSLLTGYEGFSRPFARPLSFRIYGSRGEIFLVVLFGLFGLRSLKNYVVFQRQASEMTPSRHQFSVVNSSVERSTLGDLQRRRTPFEISHQWK